VFVDEGHKGAGAEGQTWKNRQRALSRGGFLVEYSATLCPSVGAASGAKRDALMSDYGKCIWWIKLSHFMVMATVRTLRC